MGAGAAVAAGEAAGKFAIFLCFALPVAVLVGTLSILGAIAIFDRHLLVGRMIAIAGGVTAGFVGMIALILAAAYLAYAVGLKLDDWSIEIIMAAIWLALVGWQLTLALGIFYKRDLGIDAWRKK